MLHDKLNPPETKGHVSVARLARFWYVACPSEQLAQKPGNVDLQTLFARLGVHANGASVVFDDAAPLAAIRHAITARRPG